MTALRMKLDALRARATEPALAEQVGRTCRLAEELDQTIDALTSQLRPTALDHLGLTAALQNLVARWSQRFGITAEFDALGMDGVRLAPDVEANLYHLAQEALHNVLKHARAQHVSVLLERRSHEVVLVIEDDGRGFRPSDVMSKPQPGCFGLAGMRERATLIGGELDIESAPGRGTAIFVRVAAGLLSVPPSEVPS